MFGGGADDLDGRAASLVVRRSEVRAPSGVTYLELRATLTPRWWLVRLHIAVGYLALAALATASAATWAAAPTWLGVLTVGPFAAAVGFTIHYLHLFMHEAAHFNLAADRRRNDLLANVVIGPLVGMSIRPYRPTHFNHHRYLGTPQDTEISYFDPLDVRFLVEALVGVKVIEAIVNRNRVATPPADRRGAERAALLAVVAAFLLHGAVVGIAAWQGAWGLAAAWAIGAYVGYPFFAALRTLLEHRSADADPTVDYRTTPHGAVTRLFGAGALASTFGMAGFNRHLLHHWDPQVSYTRLGEVERFLRGCESARPLFAGTETTYPAAFALLFNR